MILDWDIYLGGINAAPDYGLAGVFVWPNFGNANIVAFTASDKQFIGEVQQMGLVSILNASMGIE